MSDVEVQHRFSDFFSLYKYLVESYPGVIVPPCPPKDALGTLRPVPPPLRVAVLLPWLLLTGPSPSLSRHWHDEVQELRRRDYALCRASRGRP